MAGNLLEKGTALYERTTLLIDQSKFLSQRCGQRLARCRYLLQQRTKRRASTSLQPIIRLKLDGGRLPRVGAPIIVGRPGAGGVCAACGRVLLKRQLVMDIPAGDGYVLRLHANCYMLWNAELHRRRAAPKL